MTATFHFADVMPDGRVRACLSCEAPEVGPPVVQHAEGAPILLDGPIDWRGPTETSVLHWSAGDGLSWVETASIAFLRAARREQINTWWLDANNSYFEYRGARIAYSESDRVDIQGINNVVMLTNAMPTNPDWPAAWKTVDNGWVPIPDVAAWVEFNVAIADRGTAHFKKAQMLKAQLEAATTAAEIEAITW